MFAAKSKPFYNSAQKFLRTRPPSEESAAFLVDRFKSSGISLAKPLADEMVRRADNVPYYLQAPGSWVFNATTGPNAKFVSKFDSNAQPSKSSTGWSTTYHESASRQTLRQAR